MAHCAACTRLMAGPCRCSSSAASSSESGLGKNCRRFSSQKGVGTVRYEKKCGRKGVSSSAMPFVYSFGRSGQISAMRKARRGASMQKSA